MKALSVSVVIFFTVAALLSGQPIEKAAHDVANSQSCFREGC